MEEKNQNMQTNLRLNEKETVEKNIAINETLNETETVSSTVGVEAKDIEDLKNQLDEAKEDLKKIKIQLDESKNDFIQIFGVFASIITLVGFNATAAQKSIRAIIAGNLTLGLVLIGFIYLLYVVPKRVANDKPFISFPKFESLFEKVILGIFLVILIPFLFFAVWGFFDDKANFGFCNLYPFPKIEIGGKIYCLK